MLTSKLETIRVVDRRFPDKPFVVINRRDLNLKIHTEYDPRAPKKVFVDKAKPVPPIRPIAPVKPVTPAKPVPPIQPSFVDNTKAVSDWGKPKKTSRSPVSRSRKIKTKIK